MEDSELLAVIPVALAELRDMGRAPAYFDELSQQVTLHDEAYLRRRTILRRGLGCVGINIPDLPDGLVRPGSAKMYPALDELENAGVIVGKSEEPRKDGKPSRKMYQLLETKTTQPAD